MNETQFLIIGREVQAKELPGGNDGEFMVMATSSPCIHLIEFQPVLGGYISSKDRGFEGMPISTYNLGRWGDIF